MFLVILGYYEVLNTSKRIYNILIFLTTVICQKELGLNRLT